MHFVVLLNNLNFFQSGDDPKPAINQNGKLAQEITNETNVGNMNNNNKRKSEADINVILEEDEEISVAEEDVRISLKRADSKKEKQKRISFRGNIIQNGWSKTTETGITVTIFINLALG